MDYIKIRFSDSRDNADADEKGLPASISRFFDPLFTIYRRMWRPAVDIGESRDHYTIIVELAGVRSEDLNLEISNRTIRIHGVRIERSNENTIRYHLAEITHGSFERVLTLPVPIEEDQVEAVFSEGLLEIRIPKESPGKRVRRVPIRDR